MVTQKTQSQSGTKSIRGLQAEVQQINKMALSVDCVIFGFDENKLKVLLIRSDLKKFQGQWSLLGDLVKIDEGLDAAAQRVLKQRTGLNDLFLEQVSTFGEVGRHPGGRVVTVVYFSLINIQNHRLKILENELHWHDVNTVIDLAFDHKLIFDRSYEWLKKRVQEHPLGFNLLPKKFSLRELQILYEAILGTKLDRRNFRKKFFAMNCLIDLDESEQNVAHRPGKLYKFNYEEFQSRKNKCIEIGF